MSRSHRHRSRGRDLSRSYSSHDRSISRSKSIARSRRSRSRTYSKGRRYISRDRRSLSRYRSNSASKTSKWDRKKRSLEPTLKSELVYVEAAVKDVPNPVKRKTISNMKWSLPTPGNNRKNAMLNKSSRYMPRMNSTDSYKYESEEFKNQKEKNAKLMEEKKLAQKENQKLLAEYSDQLKSLVGEISTVPKDSDQYKELNDKIQSLKSSMKSLISSQTKRDRTVVRKNNKLDYRETRLLFTKLPDCTKGKGNLAKWISTNAKILLPKEIAMLASCDEENNSAIIQYKSHVIAEKVMDTCKLHGIAVSWAQAPDSVSSNTISIDKTLNEVDYGCLDD